MQPQPYVANGDTGFTWIWGAMLKDYLITNTADQDTIKSVVRVSPERSEPLAYPWDSSKVAWIISEGTFVSWEPSGAP